MKFVRSFLGICFLFVSLGWIWGCYEKGSREEKFFAYSFGESEVYILHTNDMHGQVRPLVFRRGDRRELFGGWEYLYSCIRRFRREHSSGGEVVFLVDGGDIFQGTPEGNLTRGRMMVDLMNLAGYDAVALGNHEFDYGQGVVESLDRVADFPFVCANIFKKESDSRPFYARPYVILERRGIRVAFLGWITPMVPILVQRSGIEGLRFSSDFSILQRLVDEVRRRGVHLVVLLSHSGYRADVELARRVSGIDVIIGGHSHTLLRRSRMVGKTVIVQVGSRGRYLGRVRFSLRGGRVVERDYSVFSITPKWGKSSEVRELVERYSPEIEKVMSAYVGESRVFLSRRSERGSSILGNFLCDAMRELAGVEVAFQNRFGIRADLPKGRITFREVYQVAPFDNTLVVMELTGEQILRILSRSLHQRACLDVSGLVCYYRSSSRGRGGNRITRVYIQGKPLERRRLYRVVTNSFVAEGGDGYRTFREGRNRRNTYLDHREALRRYIRKRSPIEYKFEQRFREE
ncbi:MAG: bifunctional metallophosphatase/5'-nucleotidase [Planctomycetota bacterium]|nr:MAG: bifunctional metallophosphatase/5'-nucleotidase [Planctomycetota bacterium]